MTHHNLQEPPATRRLRRAEDTDMAQYLQSEVWLGSQHNAIRDRWHLDKGRNVSVFFKWGGTGLVSGVQELVGIRLKKKKKKEL